ncbi:MRC1-like domain-containing protein [Morchella snyderi]|nr:MRC1-like domain-containing protein [Morchella snyderi]
MASPTTLSPPGTPSRDSMSGSPIVTPRTKVARMLASDSEDDDIEEDITVLLKKAAKPPSGVTDKKNTLRAALGSDDENEELGTEKPATERRLFNQDDDTGEDSDMSSEEEVEVRPRGKLAARMMAAHKAQAQTKKAPAPALPREHRSIFGGDEEPSDAEMGDQEDSEEDAAPAPIRKRALKQKRSSPTPSPTATPTVEEADNSDDEEDEQQGTVPIPTQRGTPAFAALVARKRAEREAREAAEAAAKAERHKDRVEQDDEEDSGSDTNHYANSQKAPSRRRAGKKAMEEIHKETQRMARSMQLAHQATTRKKITKQSLFERFNFRTAAAVDSSAESVVEKPKPGVLPLEQTIVERIEDTTMDDAEIPVPNSQLEAMDLDATPSKKLDNGKGKAVYNGPPISLGKGKGKEVASSPPRLDKGKGKGVVFSPPRLDKGKGKAPPLDTKKRLSLPPVRVILPPRPTATAADDSDSDLEILPDQSSTVGATFTERQTMIQELRKARRPSLPRAKKAGQLSAKELQLELVRKGRQQAEMEREEHIQELRAKGIIVPTAEEREKENAEVDDLLERARQEALKIKRAEKRQEKLEKGLEVDDDEDDEDWVDGEEEDPIIELLSGSDEEGGDEEEMEDVEESEEKPDVNDFSNDEEGEDGELEDSNSTPVFSLSSMRPLSNTTPRLSEIPSAYIDNEASDDSDGGDFAPLKKKKKQQRKKMCVVSDDDDEETPPAPKPAESKIPSIFRRPNAQPPMMMGMGMTQLFESTMGNPDDVQVAASQAANPEERINLLRRDVGEMLPNTQILDFGDGTQSQSQDESAKLQLDYSQSQKWPVEDSQQTSKVSLQYGSDEEDMPDPTQDQGFTITNTPAPPRFTPEPEVPSTISTQVLDERFGAQKKRRGRLVRRDMDFSDEEEEDEERVADSAAEEEDELPDVANLFNLMKRSSNKKVEKPKKPKKQNDFDKSKSEAKGMVQEQAEESEDEYAGIGGASDDDADNDHDSDMEGMVDDTNGETVDENALAAFYAEREKAQDAKDVTKLLKDMQSGFLRKKRGANFDLDDSEDEDDAEARRRAAKRRQIAKMRKELLKDENIEKIAAHPKRAAFLAAIEDRDRDEEMDFLDRGEEDLFIELGMVSQTDCVSQSQTLEGSEEASPAPMAEDEQRGERSKEAASLQASKSIKPTKNKITSLAQVREQLSFLVEERDSQIDFSDEDEEEDKTAVLRRERIGSVIDRSAVSRSNSATSSTAKLAFQTSTNASTFKVPTLLRRATSSSLSESSAVTEKTLGQGEGGVKRGGKASSSINFQSREKLRGKVIHQREVKKKIERKKEGLKRQSVLGILAKGSFS